MKSYKKFKNEMHKLEQLYGGTVFAYWEARERYSSRIKEGFLDRANKYQQGDEFEVVVSTNKQEYDAKMSSILPRYLRETIFVRLISILEIFLVDIVKELFLARKDLFHKDDRIEMSYRQLLSFESIAKLYSHLINNEIRNLQNQGFKKVREYYRKRFNVDFSKFNGDINALIEFHDRRNLIVHRLGQVDEIYRKKYGESEKVISVSKNGIVRAINIVSDFAAFICKETQDIISHSRRNHFTKDLRCLARVELKTKSNEYIAVLDKNYLFYCGDELVQLKDLLYRHNYDSTNRLHVLKVSGVESQVLGFVNEINFYAETGLVEIVDCKVIAGVRKLGRRRYAFNKQFLKNVKNELPDYPWSKDIHKQIAKRFGIKSSEAFKAIRMIKSREENSGR